MVGDDNLKIAFYTLGCKVNQYETEALKEEFARAGYQVTGEDDVADIYVINTCTVTNLADRKSRQYIRRMKRRSPEAVIAVTGCYAQTKPAEVASVEGVDIVAGNGGRINTNKAPFRRPSVPASSPQRLCFVLLVSADLQSAAYKYKGL